MAKSHQKVTPSEDTKYSQIINSPDDKPERDGRSLVTSNHEVIMRWANTRKAVPSTIEGTEHGSRAGVLRLDFKGYASEGKTKLQHISWDEWFETFDARNLNFIYQETKSDGAQSNFFRLENPKRSDA